MHRQAGPQALDQHTFLGGPLGRVWKAGHQLKGWQAGDEAEDVILPLLDGVDEEDLQQRQIQIKQHAQDAAPHQHPDHVRMDVSRGNLGEMNELFEQRREGEPEPNIELLLGEENRAVLRFLSCHSLSVHKLNEHSIRNASRNSLTFSLSTDFSA